LTTIKKIELKTRDFHVDGFLFTPDKPSDRCAIFSHGYTSSKNDLVSWAQRLAEDSISTIIFDLPGHYLGSFRNYENTSSFQLYAHELFESAYSHFQTPFDKIILGGHSLGALLSLKASMLSFFQMKDTINICVGLGVSLTNDVHLFKSSFYQKTLHIRAQLVDKNLHPDIIFPWIKKEKKELQIINKKIFIINGQDDAVVGKDGGKNLLQQLDKNNTIQLETPKTLPHHKPEIASVHIAHILKKEIN